MELANGRTFSKLWSEPQDEELRKQYAKCPTMEEIARQMGRTSSAIRSRLSVLGLHERTRYSWKMREIIASSKDTLNYHKSKELRQIEQDMAFQKAMNAAIDAGLERAPIGVSVNKKPFDAPPIQIRPSAHCSGNGSPAAQCASLGSKNSFG